MVAFFHKAGTVPFFHDSLKSSRSVFLAAGPRCVWLWHHLVLVHSYISTVLFAASISFMVIGWLMQLSDVGCFCSWALTWQVLSLGSLTLLSSWYSLASQLAASFWTISSPSDCRTVCAFSRLSPFSSLVSFHAEGKRFFMPSSVCLLELLSGKFCFGLL